MQIIQILTFLFYYHVSLVGRYKVIGTDLRPFNVSIQINYRYFLVFIVNSTTKGRCYKSSSQLSICIAVLNNFLKGTRYKNHFYTKLSSLQLAKHELYVSCGIFFQICGTVFQQKNFTMALTQGPSSEVQREPSVLLSEIPRSFLLSELPL